MPNQSPGHPNTPLESLTGVVERITFQSEESGYTVAMVQVEGRYDPVVVVGSFPAPQVGETLRAEGQWVSHPKYGRQFQLSRYETVAPTTLAGVRRYLGAGLIRGIGPKMAERIVDHFGPDTLAVIEKDPEKLRAVPGIGDKRLAVIQAAWKEQQHARQTLLFLQSHGIGTAYALKIHDHYKERAIAAVKENPYRLASEITGIGFATADQIAGKLGFKSDHPLRAESGILFVLGQLAEKGHVYFPRPALIAKCAEILEMPVATVGEALTQLALSRKVVIEPLETAAPPASEALPEAVFLSNLHQCEQHVAKKLAALKKHPSPGGAAEIDRLVEQAQQRSARSLAPAQIDAVGSAFKHNVVVITGGPGTGKTTIINTIIAICRQLQLKTSLAAPTGRAAKRMQEATGHDAKTLHRLLEFRFHQGGFQRNAQRPLGSQMVIVDEASMIDTALMHHLLQAVPPDAALILMGDINQLPSVGPGNVLADIIASHRFAVVHLTEIFRQSRESRIVVNAHRICRGDMPEIAPSSQRTDFYFRDRETPEAALEFIVALVSDHIPRLFGFHSKRDIQVLTPMHRGLAGAENLNDVLQGVLNPQ